MLMMIIIIICEPSSFVYGERQLVMTCVPLRQLLTSSSSLLYNFFLLQRKEKEKMMRFPDCWRLLLHTHKFFFIYLFHLCLSSKQFDRCGLWFCDHAQKRRKLIDVLSISYRYMSKINEIKENKRRRRRMLVV